MKLMISVHKQFIAVNVTAGMQTTTLLNKFKKPDATAMNILEVAGFDEFASRLEHMKSAHEARMVENDSEGADVLDLGC